MTSQGPITTDIDVLREMVRLAERLRDEEFLSMERTNRYNSGLIAFSTGFLSFMINAQFPKATVQIAGIFLIGSIITSLIALSPRKLHGAAVRIDEDIKAIWSGAQLDLPAYLLETADVTDKAAMAIAKRGSQKKYLTVISALCLAFALGTTYYLYTYA